jgi:hypothetical protein
MSKAKSKDRADGKLACVWCGIGTLNRVRGHAACPSHEAKVHAALIAPARQAGDAVVTTIDFDPRRQRQRMGTLHVRAVQGALGGRVVVDLVEGDVQWGLAAFGHVLRADGARALAALLTAAADNAERLVPLGEPPDAEREPARPLGKREG